MPPDRINHRRRRSSAARVEHARRAARDAVSLSWVSTREVKSSDGERGHSFLSNERGERWSLRCGRGAHEAPVLDGGTVFVARVSTLARRKLWWVIAHDRFQVSRVRGAIERCGVGRGKLDVADKRVARSAVAGVAMRSNGLSNGGSRDRDASTWRRVSRRGIRKRGSMSVGARRGGEARAERMVLRGDQQPRTIHWRSRSMENAAENVSVYI